MIRYVLAHKFQKATQFRSYLKILAAKVCGWVGGIGCFKERQ